MIYARCQNINNQILIMDIQGLVTTFEQVLSRLNKDPVQLVRTFYLIIAASVAIVNAFPPLQSRFIHYGARARKVKDEHGKPVDSPESKGLFSWFLDYLVVFQVPHSWFIHFYVVSVASSIFWAIELVRKGPVFNFLAEQHMENSSNEPSMTFNQVVLTWMLMAIQGSRRLYECITLRKPSTSKMAGPAWILGILFYLAMGITIWVEGIRKKDNNLAIICLTNWSKSISAWE
jgi:3-oxo-5-alpha-steroid 4-dehydrogenase 3